MKNFKIKTGGINVLGNSTGGKGNAQGAAVDGSAEHIKICTGCEELKEFCSKCGRQQHWGSRG